MADYQSRQNGGNGMLRIMTVYPAENVIRVKTYSPWTQQYETDSDSSSQFTLPVTLSGTPGWQLIGTTKVASGQHATMMWPARTAFTDYEWYVSLDDGHKNVAGPVWSMKTGSAAPVVALLSPNGGESFATGANINIKWAASDDVAVTSIDIFISRNGINGPYTPIVIGRPNNDMFTWNALAPGSSNTFFKVVAHDANGNSTADTGDAAFIIQTPSGVRDGRVPNVFALGILSENPFSSMGVFDVALPQTSHVKVSVYDVAGRRVRDLVDESMTAGNHTVRWNGDSKQGRVASGVYFVRMDAAGHRFIKRIVLIR